MRGGSTAPRLAADYNYIDPDPFDTDTRAKGMLVPY